MLDVSSIINKKIGSDAQFEIKETIDGTDIVGTVTVANLDDSLLAHFDIHANINFDCSRCLKKSPDRLHIEFDEEYYTQAQEDTDRLIVDNKKIDIIEPIHREIIVSIPIKPICDNTCKGLCPTCGIDLNVKKCNHKVSDSASAKGFSVTRDERWHTLEGLKTKVKQREEGKKHDKRRRK